MRKTAIFIIVLVVISVGFLSGCNEQDNTNEEITEAEIVNYAVNTIWTTGEGNNLTNYSEPGFYHEIPYDANEHSPLYVVNATVKNIGERVLENVSIEVSFKDENNETLAWRTLYINNLDILESRDFSCTFGKYIMGEGSSAGPLSYFYDISNVSFTITVIP